MNFSAIRETPSFLMASMEFSIFFQRTRFFRNRRNAGRQAPAPAAGQARLREARARAPCALTGGEGGCSGGGRLVPARAHRAAAGTSSPLRAREPHAAVRMPARPCALAGRCGCGRPRPRVGLLWRRPAGPALACARALHVGSRGRGLAHARSRVCVRDGGATACGAGLLTPDCARQRPAAGQPELASRPDLGLQGPNPAAAVGPMAPTARTPLAVPATAGGSSGLSDHGHGSGRSGRAESPAPARLGGCGGGGGPSGLLVRALGG